MPLTPEERQKLEEYERQQRELAMQPVPGPLSAQQEIAGEEDPGIGGAIIGGGIKGGLSTLAGYGVASLLTSGWAIPVGIGAAIVTGIAAEKGEEALAETEGTPGEIARGLRASQAAHPAIATGASFLAQAPLGVASLLKSKSLSEAARLGGREAGEAFLKTEAKRAGVGAGVSGLFSAGVQGTFGKFQGRGFLESIDPLTTGGDVLFGAVTTRAPLDRKAKLALAREKVLMASKGIPKGIPGAFEGTQRYAVELAQRGGPLVRFEEVSPGIRLPHLEGRPLVYGPRQEGLKRQWVENMGVSEEQAEGWMRVVESGAMYKKMTPEALIAEKYPLSAEGGPAGPGALFAEGRFEPIRIGSGEYGGKVIHLSAREPGKVQVTRFTEEELPAGHDEYDSLGEALAAHFDELRHPVSRLLAGSQDRGIRVWEEATFEHPYKNELTKKEYAYVSPYRPLSGVSVEGQTSIDKSGRIGVLYRDTPLPLEQQQALSIFPVTKKAIRAAADELAADVVAPKPEGAMFQDAAGAEAPPFYSKLVRATETVQQKQFQMLQKRGAEAKAAIEFKATGEAVMRGLKSPDFSSLVHETGHYFRRLLDPDDMKVAAEWAGAKDIEKWDVAAEEKFARGFERYIATGQAPSPRMQSVFEKFKAWMLTVYRQIAGSEIDVEISPEIRKVFDKLTKGAGESQIVSAPTAERALDVTAGAKQSLRATFGDKAGPAIEALENANGAGSQTQAILDEEVPKIWGPQFLRFVPKPVRQAFGIPEPITGEVKHKFSEYSQGRMTIRATKDQAEKFTRETNKAIAVVTKDAEIKQRKLDRQFDKLQEATGKRSAALQRLSRAVSQSADRALSEAEQASVMQDLQEITTQFRLQLPLDKPFEKLKGLAMLMKREGRDALTGIEQAEVSAAKSKMFTSVVTEVLEPMEEKTLRSKPATELRAVLDAPTENLESLNRMVAALEKSKFKEAIVKAQNRIMAKHRKASAIELRRPVRSIAELKERLGRLSSLEMERAAKSAEGLEAKRTKATERIQANLDKKVTRIQETLGSRELQSPMSLAQAKAVVAGYEADPELGPLFKERHENKMAALEAVIREAEKGDILTPESAGKLARMDAYEKRAFIQHFLGNARQFTDTSGRRVTVSDSGIKALDEGSIYALETNSQELFERTIQSLHDRQFKNVAAKELLKLAEISPDQEFLRMANPNDIAYIRGAEGKLSMDLPELPGHKMFLSAMVRGEPMYMVADKRWAQHWIQQDPQIASNLANMLGWLSGAKLLRPMATGINPGFWITNMPRDFMHNWLATGLWTKGAYTSRVPLLGMLQETGDYIATIPEIAPELARLFRVSPKGLKNDAIQAGMGMGGLSRGSRTSFAGIPELAALGNGLGLIGDRIELWSRLAMYRRAMKNFEPLLKRGEMTIGDAQRSAANQARKAIDFSKYGTWAKAADTVMPYLTASIAGTRDLYGGLKAQGAGAASYKLAQLATLAGGLYLANRLYNREAYDQVSDYEKLNNFIFTTPFYSTDKDGKKKYRYMRIAKDQSQRPFAAFIEALMAKSLDGEAPNEAWWNVIRGMQQAIPMMGEMSILPPTLEAITGAVSNHDWWKDEAIWRGRPVEAQDEITRYTSPMAIDLGQTLGRIRPELSPARLDYIARTVWTSNLWTSMVGAGYKGISSHLPAEVEDEMSGWMAGAWDRQILQRVSRKTRPENGVGGIYHENKVLEQGYNSIRVRVKRHISQGNYPAAKQLVEQWNRRAWAGLTSMKQRLGAEGEDVGDGFMARYTFQDSDVQRIVQEMQSEVNPVDASRGLGLRMKRPEMPRRPSRKPEVELFGVSR